MTGLVGTYAEIASRVFALSAAFQFLKNASDVTNLIAGQEALGSVTGVAYKLSLQILKPRQMVSLHMQMPQEQQLSVLLQV